MAEHSWLCNVVYTGWRAMAESNSGVLIVPRLNAIVNELDLRVAILGSIQSMGYGHILAVNLIEAGDGSSLRGGGGRKKGGKEEKEGGGEKGGEKGGERGGERKRGKFKELYLDRNCNCGQPCWGCFGLFGPHQCSEAIPPPPPISYY